MNRDSPSPPPSSLCFSSRQNNSNGQSNDKKLHRHQYDDPYQNLGLCGCRRTPKSRCISAIGKYFIPAQWIIGAQLKISFTSNNWILGFSIHSIVTEIQHYNKL